MKRHILYLLCTVVTLASSLNAVAFYNPSTGRWLSRDPIGEEAGNNLHAFVGNNPVNAFDPMGMIGTMIDTEAAMAEGEAMEAGGVSQMFGVLGKVRNLIDSFNDIQRITAKLEDGEGLDIDDYISMLAVAASTLTGGVNGKNVTTASQILGVSKNQGKTVGQILSNKLGSIKNAALPPGSPSWDDILHMKWEDVVAKARAGEAGFKTFLKLLGKGEYDK